MSVHVCPILRPKPSSIHYKVYCFSFCGNLHFRSVHRLIHVSADFTNIFQELKSYTWMDLFFVNFFFVLNIIEILLLDVKSNQCIKPLLLHNLHNLHRCQPLRFFRNCYEFRAKITMLRSTVYLLRISDNCRPGTFPI